MVSNDNFENNHERKLFSCLVKEVFFWDTSRRKFR